MQVQRHAETLEAREQHVEARVVEEAPAGVAVDHRALHAELADRALELVRRRARVGRGQGGEGGEALRVLVDRARELVVGFAREGHGGLGVVEVLDARRGMADDLQVDAGGVHGRQPSLAQIEQVGFAVTDSTLARVCRLNQVAP